MKIDREKNSLLGLVHTLHIKRAKFSKQNGRYVEEPYLFQTTIYDVKGNEIEDAYYNADSSLQSRTTSSYSITGKLTEKAHYDADGSLSDKTILTYNKDGEVKEKLCLTSDSYLTEKMIFTYDASGRRVEELYVEESTVNPLVIEGIIYNVPGTSLVKSVYDPDDRLTEVHFYGADRSLISKVIMTYDNVGKLLSSMQYAGDNFFHGKPTAIADLIGVGDLFIGRTYLYDAEGKKIEENSYFAGSLESKIVITYDPQGIKTEEAEYGADNSLRSRMEFSYEFDSIGNWTKETVSGWLTEFGGFEPMAVTYRTFSYY